MGESGFRTTGKWQQGRGEVGWVQAGYRHKKNTRELPRECFVKVLLVVCTFGGVVLFLRLTQFPSLDRALLLAKGKKFEHLSA